MPTRHPDYQQSSRRKPGYPRLRVADPAKWKGVGCQGNGESLKTTFGGLPGFLGVRRRVQDGQAAAGGGPPAGAAERHVPDRHRATITIFVDPISGMLTTAYVAGTFF